MKSVPVHKYDKWHLDKEDGDEEEMKGSGGVGEWQGGKFPKEGRKSMTLNNMERP